MKKLVLNTMAVVACSATIAQTQLTNPGFENWTTNTEHPPNSYEEPEGWGIDACANVNDGPWTCDIFAEKSTDANSGSYAAKIKNTASNYGRMAVAGATAGFGVPFTGDPTSISFYVKTSLAAGESFKVNVSTFDASFNIYKTVEKTYTTAYASYTMITLPLNDGGTTGTPEKVYVNFEIVPAGTPDASSYILVDDVSFDYPTSTTAPASAEVSTFPNPVKDVLNVSEVVTYQLTSLTGAVVSTGTSNVINTSGLVAGTYVLTGTTANGSAIRKKVVKM